MNNIQEITKITKLNQNNFIFNAKMNLWKVKSLINKLKGNRTVQFKFNLFDNIFLFFLLLGAIIIRKLFS